MTFAPTGQGGTRATMMEQMSAASRKPPNVCYRCGLVVTTKAREHVVPRCLYPDEPAANLLTVPACRDCNNAFARDEEYFRLFLTAHWIPSPAARTVWEQKVRPSFERGWDGLRKLAVANMRDFYLPSGTGFVRTGLLKGDAARMDRVAEKIVRALYYHVTGKVMPPEAKMNFHWRPRDWLPEAARRGRLITIDPAVFLCRYAIASRGPAEMSIWWMLFYQSLMYVVTARAPARLSGDGRVEGPPVQSA